MITIVCSINKLFIYYVPMTYPQNQMKSKWSPHTPENLSVVCYMGPHVPGSERLCQARKALDPTARIAKQETAGLLFAGEWAAGDRRWGP